MCATPPIVRRGFAWLNFLRPLVSVTAVWLVVAGSSLFGATAGTGVISGNVSNRATGNMLEGARIHLPALGRTVFTDNTGTFVLTNLPPGTHEMVVSYIGLDAATSNVEVRPGDRTVRDFDLTSGIYQLEAF